jgi:hypothetical protein
MPTQDTTQIKDKIISFIRSRGPTLPVYVAKEVDQSILFTSAFLSELLSEKRLKISNMKVGSTPIYFIPGQEPQLDKFSQYLKSKEKEAYTILKEKQILKDTEQQPAIRVALRAIKDFAIPYKEENEIFWRYLTTPKPEVKEKIEIQEIPKEEIKKEIQKAPEPKEEIQEKPSQIPTSIIQDVKKQQEKTELDIFDKKPEPQKEIIQPKKKATKKKPAQKANEKFFNKIKEYLADKSIEITGIEGFSKSDLTLKISKEQKEYLLVAYNKKRITETDITHAYKKANEYNLPYIIFSLGEPTKKMNNFIEAIKNMSEMEKIE